jgi:hypothetical protein
MSFSSNIFTNLPLVHTLNPDFLGQQLWLYFSVGSRLSSRVTPELGPQRIPESAVLRSSRHRQLEVPGFRMFVTPFLHQVEIPELHTFANSRLHRFQASENREFPTPEKHVSRTLSSLSFRGWRVFLSSPISILCWYPSDLPGVNLTTNDRMILYFCLMTKVDWFRQ